MGPTDSNSGGRIATGQPRQRSGQLLLRSYDHQWAYDVDVVLAREAEVRFAERYYLLPGHTESEANAVPSGDYRVEVTLDNDQTAVLECRLDATPAHTAVIEVGNGAIGVTEGLTDER